MLIRKLAPRPSASLALFEQIINPNQNKGYINNFSVNSTLSFSIASTKPRSYYQILGVDKNFSSKQIRAKFLKKARQLHPDHNESKEAIEQFKRVKEAYETLKDPQKRYMYDTGLSVEPGQESTVQQEFVNNQSSRGRKYYENKWYQYKKPTSYSDQRDDFYEQRRAAFSDGASGLRSSYIGKATLLALILIGVFGYDIFMEYYEGKKHATNQLNKKLIESTVTDQKKTIMMQKYINSRSRQHAVE